MAIVRFVGPKLQNINTHRTFIRLAFNNGFHWVDIEDLWDIEEDLAVSRKVFKAISKQGMRLVKKYRLRTEHIDTNVNAFLNASLSLCR